MSPGRWLVCRWTVTPLTPPYAVYSCYYSTDPPPSDTFTIAKCGEVEYPRNVTLYWTVDGAACGCLENADQEVTWLYGNPTTDYYGFWNGFWECSIEGGRVTVNVKAMKGGAPGMVTWEIELQRGEFFYEKTLELPCGIYPTEVEFGRAPGTCGRSNLFLNIRPTEP